LPCRAIAVTGDVRQEAGDEMAPVPEHAEIGRNGWLLLPADARLVVKDPRTGRETTFLGPGRAKACVSLDEESWLASGAFESALGTGDAPGAEEWVVTPLGVVRFGAAKLSIDVSAREVRIHVSTGPTFAWTSEDASGRSLTGGNTKAIETDEGWLRMTEGVRTLVPTSPAPRLALARTAAHACAKLAKAAHDLAAALLESDADPLTAMRQVSTRRSARAACAVAGLRTDSLSPSDASPEVIANLSGSLKNATALWRSLPLR
jgi:hypothetical protein